MARDETKSELKAQRLAEALQLLTSSFAAQCSAEECSAESKASTLVCIGNVLRLQVGN